ncbi:MAG: hypothetical protein FWC95_08655, partial [Defluviitaleaceae bacterium]|nr:hypothetical protein [Defluviitaleaceae bacterium]
MKDVFKEQLIKRPMVFRDHVIFSGSVAAAIFLSYFAFLFMDGFAFMAIGVMCFILYYVFIMLKKEFEYSFTNGELDIDCIYGQRKRKRKFTCEVRDVGFLIHSSNATRDNELSAAEVVL